MVSELQYFRVVGCYMLDEKEKKKSVISLLEVNNVHFHFPTPTKVLQFEKGKQPENLSSPICVCSCVINDRGLTSNEPSPLFQCQYLYSKAAGENIFHPL